MAKVNFKRYNTKEEALASDIIDGNYIVTKDGGNYVDFDGKRVPIGGTPDTEMSDTSENSVQNKIVKKYVDDKFDKISVYSTEEKVIGKWIDGKPLYRKIIDTNDNSSNILHGISNLKNVINCKGNIKRTSSEVVSQLFPHADTDSNYNVDVNYFSSTTIVLVIGTGILSTIAGFTLILEYTKTTD